MWVVITAQSVVSVLTVLADLRLAGIARTQPFFSTFSFWIQKSLATVDWEFLLLSQARDGFTDFVPWSMGCNYIFTIGSPSYNVQRMLTICFNTSPAGCYSAWLLSVPIFIDIFLSRPEPWGSAQTWAPLKGYFDRNHFSSEPGEREQWMNCPGLAGGELSWWWENDKTRGNLESQSQGRGPLDAVTPYPWILQHLEIMVRTLSCDH